MELITTYICKASDIGVHSNMFGGTMLALIDQSSGAYASQICDTPRMVTIKRFFFILVFLIFFINYNYSLFLKKKMVNVSINGFGRIGRLCYKILSKKNNVKIESINCGSNPEIFLHLLKYDSTYGVDETIKDLKIFQENDEIFFVEKDTKIKIFSEKNMLYLGNFM